MCSLLPSAEAISPALLKMAREVFLVLLLLLLLGYSMSEDDDREDTKSYEFYKVYRLHPTTYEQNDWLRYMRVDNDLDFWTIKDVMVTPWRQESFLEQLKEKEIAWEVLVPDVQEAISAEHQSPQRSMRDVNTKKYFSYEEIQAYMNDLGKKYPEIVAVKSIGKTFEGRDLSIITMSIGANAIRPIIIIDAAIHGREWIGPAMALYIMEQLVENATNANLIANVDWHIIPVLNPDGYEYSCTEQDRMWRKTRSVTTSCWGSDDKQGVDADRNFDYHWGEFGASQQPCQGTYCGPKPFSEPETDAFRKYVLANAANIRLYVSFHSHGRMITYPRSYITTLHPNWRKLHDLATKATAAQKAAGGEPYAIGGRSTAMYPTSGSSTDWVCSVGGVNLTYVIHLPGGGSTGFDLPAADLHGALAGVWPAIRAFGEHVAAL